jgi:hypothetical protein
MNLGITDRIIRVIAGFVIIAAAFFLTTGVLQIILWIVGAIALLTGIIGFCGLYKICGCSTKK